MLQNIIQKQQADITKKLFSSNTTMTIYPMIIYHLFKRIL